MSMIKYMVWFSTFALFFDQNFLIGKHDKKLLIDKKIKEKSAVQVKNKGKNICCPLFVTIIIGTGLCLMASSGSNSKETDYSMHNSTSSSNDNSTFESYNLVMPTNSLLLQSEFENKQNLFSFENVSDNLFNESKKQTEEEKLNRYAQKKFIQSQKKNLRYKK